MRKFFLLLLFLLFIPGCFITVLPSYVPAPMNNDDDKKEARHRSPYASDFPKPAWVNHPSSYWEEGKYMYAVGVATKSEVHDFDIRLRIAEMEGKRVLLLANNICAGMIVGGIPLKQWVSEDETVHMLVRGEIIIPLERCKP